MFDFSEIFNHLYELKMFQLELSLKVLNYLYDYFFTSELGMIEFVASAITLLCVFQLSKQNIWGFFWSVLGAALFGFLFYKTQLYADMTLQLFYYLPMSVIGAWYWYYMGPKKDELPISIGTNKDWIVGVTSLIFATLATGYFFKNYTQAVYPYPDSFILVASIYAQYLLNKKILESWLLWVSVDAVAIPVYFMKGLYVASGLYVILFCIAFSGLISWFKEWDNENRIDNGKVSTLP